MSPLLIDSTYLDGRNGDIMVKEFAAVDFQSKRDSYYVFKRPTAGRNYQCLTPEWIKLSTKGVIGMMVMYYS